MARKRFTEREVVGIVARQLDARAYAPKDCVVSFDGYIICPICDEPITLAQIPDIIRDHDRALGLLGPDTPQNCSFIHGHCDRKVKTPSDLKTIAKAKRQAGETGQRARRERRGGSSIQGRPLDGTKASGWHKGFDGKAERRT